MEAIGWVRPTGSSKGAGEMMPRAGFEPASPTTKVGRYLGQITGWKPDSPVFIPGYANAAETNVGDSNRQRKESVGWRRVDTGSRA